VSNERKDAFKQTKVNRRAFLKAVRAAAVEYADEAEHQDGHGYWKNFATAEEAVRDFHCYLPFALESVIDDDPKLKVQLVAADWKDIEGEDGLIMGFYQALRRLGVFMVNHPDFEGSDTYGFLLSNRAMTKAEIADESIDKQADK